jgi:fimbrial chaperone protein
MARLRHFVAGAVSALALACGSLTPAVAHEVTPMRVELVPQAGSRTALVSVRNTRENDLPFEVVALRRLTAPDGTETLEPADEDFLIFPPQGLVKSGASQSVRFEYVGDQNLAESRSYVLDVREVPVTPPGFSGILTVYNFGVAVYVKPPGAFADLEVSGISREGDLITFDIRTRGNDFVVLSRHELEIRFGAETIRMTGSEFAGRVSNPVVPPNSVRHFQMRADGLPADAPSAIRVRSAD